MIKRLALDVRLSMRASRVEGDSVGTEDAALIHWVCQGASSKIGLIRWACGSGGRSRIVVVAIAVALVAVVVVCGLAAVVGVGCSRRQCSCRRRHPSSSES